MPHMSGGARGARGSVPSQALMTLSLLGVSLPTFLIGILLILLFAVTLKWLPSFGRGDVVTLGAWTSGLRQSSDSGRSKTLPTVRPSPPQTQQGSRRPS